MNSPGTVNSTRPLMPVAPMLLAGALSLALLGDSNSVDAAASAANIPAEYRRDATAETAMKITAPFTVAAVGDIIMPQPLNRDVFGQCDGAF